MLASVRARLSAAEWAAQLAVERESDGRVSRDTYIVAEILWAMGWSCPADAQLSGLDAAIPLIREHLTKTV